MNLKEMSKEEIRQTIEQMGNSFQELLNNINEQTNFKAQGILVAGVEDKNEVVGHIAINGSYQDISEMFTNDKNLKRIATIVMLNDAFKNIEKVLSNDE